MAGKVVQGATQVIASFTDFRGGEYGTVGARNAPKDTFTARNIARYRTGGLGPRAGLHNLEVQGLPIGRARGLFWPRALGEFAYVVIGREVWRFRTDRNAATAQRLNGNLNTIPTKHVDGALVANDLYLTSYGDASYIIADPEADTPTLAPLGSGNTKPPGGRTICLYGERLLIGGLPGAPARFVYSEPADFANFTVTNFLDVSGESVEIRGLYVMRDFLIAITADLSVYVITGVPGVNAQLRRQVSYPEGNVPIGQHLPLRGALDLASSRLWMVGQHAACPIRFNGARIEHASAVVFADTDNDDSMPPPFGVAALQEPDEIVMFGNDRAALYREQTWTLHEFDAPVSGLGAASFTGEVLLTDGGTDAAAPVFRIWNTSQDQSPSKASGFRAYTEVGDGTDTAPDTYLETREEWPDPDYEYEVTGILLDITVRPTGVPKASCHIEGQVVVVGADGEAYESLSDPFAWDAPADRAPADGHKLTLRLPARNAARGRGVRVRLTDWRGVEVLGIRVLGKPHPQRWA